MALFIIADDSSRIARKMARGRGGYESDVILTPRRKPVRIEDVDHVYTGSRKAARISDYASEDGDDLAKASRSKDRRLLNDISSKLAVTSNVPLAPLRRGRPPVAPVGRKPVFRPGIRPVPALSSRNRAYSVPAVYVEEEVITPYNYYEVPSSYYRPLPVRTVPRHRASSEPPYHRSSDLAVRNAKRCLARIEKELGFESDYDYVPTVRRQPVMLREPIIVAEPVVRARTTARSAGTSLRRRPGSLPPPVSRNRISQSEIEREVEEYLEKPVFTSTLRKRASSLERARLPVPSSPSLTRRRADSLDRMPQLDPYRPNQGKTHNDLSLVSAGSYGSVAPYIPARISSAPRTAGLPPKNVYRPSQSDTRNRIRFVICYLKNNPYYFR